MKKTKLTRSLLAAFSIVALTAVMYGCTHSSDDPPATEMEQTPAEQIAALQAQINTLRAELGLDPIDIDDLTGSVADLTRQVTSLKKQIDDAAEEKRMAEEEAARKAAAATGKALFAALAGPAATDNALANLEVSPPVFTATGDLTIDAAAGAGSLADAAAHAAVDLEAGDSVAALGSWNGTDYMHMAGTGDAKVTNEARVYTNKGPGRSLPFSNTETNGRYLLITDAGATQGYVLLGDTTTGQESPVTRASAAAFTHSGTQTHQTPSQSDAFYVRGTYDGAPGQFRCAGTNCSSTNDGKGNVSALGGTWHFKPDSGAMVMEADAHYLYYGWWVSKDDEGAPTAASAFAGRFGTDPGDSTDGLDMAAGGETLTGSATYAGHAAGKFAISNPLDSTGNGGHFTADAMLTATFGTGATAGMTGTIDNFRLNDGSDDPGWSVSLHRAGWGTGTTGQIVAPVDDPATTGVNEAMGTTWSIGDNSGGRSGTWSGQMYDEMPGDPPNGDGSTIPTTVTGTFYSEFSTIGRMVGAFGADKE